MLENIIPQIIKKQESEFIESARRVIFSDLPRSITERRMRETQIEILKVLEAHGPLIRGQKYDKKQDTLIAITKYARSTVYDNLEKLKKKKLVERFSEDTDYRGRPVIYWRIVK